MARRFTDTEKWKKPFIRGLQGAYKLLWLYICDDCDHAGIWQVDMDVAKIRIGEDIDVNNALASFGDKVVSFDNGTKWFIPSFLEFQYPSGLNPENNAHSGVIRLLEKYKLLKNKPLTSPSQESKDMDKDMVMDKDKEEGVKKEKIEYAFNSDNFKKCFDEWIEFRKQKKKSLTPLTIKKQNELLLKYPENIAIQIIEKSITNGWAGLFEPKDGMLGQSGRQKTPYELEIEQKRQEALKRSQSSVN